MRLHIRVAALLAAAAAATAGAPLAHAQAGPLARSLHVGVAGGVTLPLSDVIASTENLADGGPGFGAKTGYHFTGLVAFSAPLLPLGLRAEFMYHSIGGKGISFDDPDFGSLSATPDLRLMAGTLNGVISASGVTPLKPYVIGGVGVYNTRTTMKASGSLLEGLGAVSVHQSDTNLGLNGGIGVRFALGGVSAFVEGRFHHVFDKQRCSLDPEATDVCFPRDDTSIIPLSVGIMF